jgi:hypothetical protein
MSKTTSPSVGKPYGLERVCRVLDIPRATIYAQEQRQAANVMPLQRARRGRRCPAARETYGVRALIFGALMVGFAAAIIWLLYPQITSFLLAQAGNAYHFQFRALIWAAPFFVAAPLLSSMLLGLGLETMTLSISALCVVATLLVAVFVGAAAAFVLGSVLAAISPAVAGWWLGFRRTRG